MPDKKTEKEEKPAQNQGSPESGKPGTSTQKQGVEGDRPGMQNPREPGPHSGSNP